MRLHFESSLPSVCMASLVLVIVAIKRTSSCARNGFASSLTQLPKYNTFPTYIIIRSKNTTSDHSTSHDTMSRIGLFTHVNCSLSRGPGERDNLCGICLEPKTVDDETVTHECKNSFHASCFEQWSSSCRTESLNVTCPSCRAILVDVNGPEEADGDFVMLDAADDEVDSPVVFLTEAEIFPPGQFPYGAANVEMFYEPFDEDAWQIYSEVRDTNLFEIEDFISGGWGWGGNPVSRVLDDTMALHAHQTYQQVSSRRLADVVENRYNDQHNLENEQSRQRLIDSARLFGVDMFRCYLAPAGSGFDYFLAADYLDQFTDGVRRVGDYRPIPDNVLAMQREIALSCMERRARGSDGSLDAEMVP